MALKFTNLQCKEVICVSNGQRLGFISDILIEVPKGDVCSIVVPCERRGLVSRHDDFIIPWSCIKKIGPDIVLVDTKPEDCRVPRQKPGLAL